MAGLTLLVAAPLQAQPWVPSRGEGSVAVTYQNYYDVGHYDVAGVPNTNGATHSKALITELDLGVTDNIGLTISLPFIASKYTGSDQYTVGKFDVRKGPLDDRTYHGALQDLHVEARRLFTAGPVAIAPLVGMTIPTHDYPTIGEAVPGRHRRELQLGATAGTDLNRLLPGTYVHGRYALAAAERINGFSSVKSNAEVEGGFDATSFLSVYGLSVWQIRHDGPTVPELHAKDWEGHDRFIVSSYFNLGGGLTLTLNRRTELNVLWMATVSGRSGAHRARMLAIGTTWSFGGMGWGGGFASLNDRPSQSNPRAAGS